MEAPRPGGPAAPPGALVPPTGGLHPAQLASLPSFRYRTRVGADADDCAVCQSPFEEKQRVRALPGCTHVFHVHCVDPWLLRRATCPLCRSPVTAATPPPVKAPPPARRVPPRSPSPPRRVRPRSLPPPTPTGPTPTRLPRMSQREEFALAMARHDRAMEELYRIERRHDRPTEEVSRVEIRHDGVMVLLGWSGGVMVSLSWSAGRWVENPRTTRAG